MIRRFVLLLLLVVAFVVALAPATASAHNSLESSAPANGAVIDASPPEIRWLFANSVPLDTLTVTLVDAAGVRSDISGSTHGTSGSSEVVTPLPTLPPGATTLRWRLVGPDGHPVTGRVAFTITPPAASVPVSTAAEADANPPVIAPAPMSTAVGSGDTIDQAAARVDSDTAASGPSSVLRWMLRALSYLSIMIAAGVVMTQAFVWGDTGWGRSRQWLTGSLVATAVLAFLQLLVIAADISGRSMFGSLASIDPAFSTDAGVAFGIRIVLAGVAWLLIVHAPATMPDVRSSMLVLLSLGMLGTWSFAGHSRSMRWPAIGVPVDMIHHGAAAAWLGGVFILGLGTIATAATDDLAPIMRRFSRTAEIAVVLIVATGFIQAVRLVGNPVNVFAASHGRLLIVKLMVVGLMLWAAHGNRQRVVRVVRSAGAAARLDVANLRRAMVIELVVGLAIIGITAAMVVSPPTAGP